MCPGVKIASTGGLPERQQLPVPEPRPARQRMIRMRDHLSREKAERLPDRLRMVEMAVSQQDIARRDASGRFDRPADHFGVAGRIDQQRVSIRRDRQIAEIVIETADRKLVDRDAHQYSPIARERAA